MSMNVWKKKFFNSFKSTCLFSMLSTTIINISSIFFIELSILAPDINCSTALLKICFIRLSSLAYLTSNKISFSCSSLQSIESWTRLYIEGEHYKIYIKQWSEILNDAEARLSFLQDKLNLEVAESEGINLLKKLHPDYLPWF